MAPARLGREVAGVGRREVDGGGDGLDVEPGGGELGGLSGLLVSSLSCAIPSAASIWAATV